MLMRVALSTLCLASGLTAYLSGQEDLAMRATWQPPAALDVRESVLAWVAKQPSDGGATLSQVDALWPAGDLPQVHASLLERVMETIALFDVEARLLVERCRTPPPTLLPPPPELLTDESRAPLVRFNARLYYARWLAQHAYYDEALEQLAGLLPEDVVDPASLLFYQSVSSHRLLQKEQCLATVQRLLENERSLPRRYASVARLMEADIKPLQMDSLDEVSRLMEDIRRRLNLGRAGTRVRQEEDDVIAKLDKMIEELEKQRQQQQASGNGGGNLQPSSPAEQSGNYGGSGPGDVDQKRPRNQSNWGNLPPKERQEALQQISKDLPAHYREVIEEYFRKLARDGDQP